MGSLAKRWLTALFEHTEGWGTVWFGLLFWGSVINAVVGQFSGGWQPWLVGLAAYGMGLAMGVVAKLRGRWL